MPTQEMRWQEQALTCSWGLWCPPKTPCGPAGTEAAAGPSGRCSPHSKVLSFVSCPVQPQGQRGRLAAVLSHKVPMGTAGWLGWLLPCGGDMAGMSPSPSPTQDLAAETSLVAIGRVGVGTFIKEMNNCK